MKKLYVSDLDGTLLHPDVLLSPNTILILNTLIEQGLLFTVATARSIASVKTILKDVNISLPIILMNGVCIYDLSKNGYLKVETFPRKSLDMLLSLIKEHQQKGFAYTLKDGIMSTYYEDLNSKALKDFCQERMNRYQKGFKQIDDFAVLSDESFIYFTMLDQKEKLEPIFHIIEKIPELNCVLYKDNYSPDLWYLETYSKTASKAQAVQFLRENLSFDHIICFGDNHNDLSMFEASDYRIAVGNAVPDLKEKADLVIGNNYDDGVAAWLKHNFINT